MMTVLRQIWRQLRCLSGRHDDPTTITTATEIYLRCPHCRRRSPGWPLTPKPLAFLPVHVDRKLPPWPRRIATAAPEWGQGDQVLVERRGNDLKILGDRVH
jgi:hypothetical protein